MVAKVGGAGKVSVFNFSGNVDVIVDVLGWFPTGGSYTGVTPARILETRAGLPTTDGNFAGTGAMSATGTLNLAVLGRGGVPATGVGAVAVNLTVTSPTANSFLTLWPTGSPRPTASNLNFVAGQTTANMVIAKLGDGGQVSLYNLAGTPDVIVDVLGWFPTGGSYTSLSPARLLDTRALTPTTPTAPAAAPPAPAPTLPPAPAPTLPPAPAPTLPPAPAAPVAVTYGSGT